MTAVATGNNNAVAGGLVAWSNSSAMEAIYATGDVTATGSANSGSDVDAGGLLGRSETGTTSRAVYSTGNISASAGGTVNVGGLVGHNKSGSTLTVGWSKLAKSRPRTRAPAAARRSTSALPSATRPARFPNSTGTRTTYRHRRRRRQQRPRRQDHHRVADAHGLRQKTLPNYPDWASTPTGTSTWTA